MILYIAAKIKEQSRVELYRFHMSNALCIISESAARCAGDGSRYLDRSYYDLLNKAPEEKRTGQEIVTELVNRMGLEVI